MRIKSLILIIILLVFGAACAKKEKPTEEKTEKLTDEHSYKIEGDFQYEVKNNRIIITGYKGKKRDIVIPEKINDLPVVEIGGEAFYENCLSKVIIPNSVETIGELAFDGDVKIIRK
jgi:hypothetical protein